MALLGLGLLGSGVSGVAAIDGDLQKVEQQLPRPQESDVLVRDTGRDCPYKDRQRGGTARDASIKN
ncbi:MAG: hypothetical protein HZB46_12735 [Solirubrobacterales bacterium]|nr:hypothetical protein [Solirubrobacterales bacterium]